LVLLPYGLQAAEVPASKPAGVGSAQPGTPQIAKGALAQQEYVDGSFGFAVRPLAGATVDRRKRTVEGHVQLAQFVRMEVAWSMSVRLWTSSRPIDVPAAKEAMFASLSRDYPDLQVTEAQAIHVDGRDGARLLGTFTNEGQLWVRQEAVIPLRGQDYILLVLATLVEDRDVAVTAFGQIIDSFKVVRTQAQQEELDAALRRGTALLQDIAADGKKVMPKPLDKPLYLRLMREGRPIGFLAMFERGGTLEREEGLQMQQQAWLFNPDESVQYQQEDKFVAGNLAVDEWRIITQTMPPKAYDAKQRLVVSVEGGIRRNDKLVVEFTQQVGVTEKQSKVIETEASYASLAWPVLLPRLVDLSKPELYAFSMYDPERRGLILRTFRVVGPVQVAVGGRQVSAVRIEDSEGLVPPVSQIDVDEQGRLLRISSGPVETALTSQAEIEREFGPRVKAIQAQFRDSNPQPQAGAAKDQKNAGTQAPAAGKKSSGRGSKSGSSDAPTPRKQDKRSKSR
jgi:hypothetical protein